MNRQVILITPGYPSLGLISIGSFLERHGYDVSIIAHDEFFLEKLTRFLDRSRCIAVGFTATTASINSVISAGNAIREYYPKIPLLIGGNHATALPEETLKESGFDIAVSGEGELTVLEVLKKLGDGVFPTHAPGTYEKTADGTIIGNGARPLIEDLSILPPLNYRLYDFKYLPLGIRDRQIKSRRGLHFMVSRGCPYNCVFCASEAIWRRKIRFRKSENIIDELEYLISNYNLDSISFADDELITNREFVTSLCRTIIKRGLHKKIIWECQGRVDLLSQEVLEIIKKAGCRLIRFGMESGSDKILTFLKNNTFKVSDSYNAVKLCNKNKMHCFGSFMIGSPDENLEDILATIDLIEKSGLDSAACYALVPYPGTCLYNLYKDTGLLKAGVTWKDFVLERFARENIPPFVVGNHHFSPDQLYHISRYIDQNVVSRLNYKLPLRHVDHRKNLERIIAGETKLANPSFRITLAQKGYLHTGWLTSRLAFIRDIATDFRIPKFIILKLFSRLGNVVNFHLWRRFCGCVYQSTIEWHFRSVLRYSRARCFCEGQLLPAGQPDRAVCADCGCYINTRPPLPEELRRFYALNLYWQKRRHLDGFPSLREMEELFRSSGELDNWLRMILRYGPSNGRVIQVDSVPGGLLCELGRKGYACTGTVASRKTADWLRRSLGLKMQAGLFPYMELAQCDLFLATDALEYTPDPLIFMRRLRRLLSENAVAIIQIQIRDKIKEPVAESGFDECRLFGFCDKTINVLARYSDLEVVAAEPGLREAQRVYVFRKTQPKNNR